MKLLATALLVVAASASNTTVVSPAGIMCTKIDGGATACKLTADFKDNFKKAHWWKIFVRSATRD